ncbi:hypothetical protein HDU79_010779 [Rhizoclosmatium sp. JEL0117]|nr:hypothetical protein HDU79_010779 [Rhizoclosmatium sp. JEL0117]
MSQEQQQNEAEMNALSSLLSLRYAESPQIPSTVSCAQSPRAERSSPTSSANNNPVPPHSSESSINTPTRASLLMPENLHPSTSPINPQATHSHHPPSTRTRRNKHYVLPTHIQGTEQRFLTPPTSGSRRPSRAQTAILERIFSDETVEPNDEEVDSISRRVGGLSNEVVAKWFLNRRMRLDREEKRSGSSFEDRKESPSHTVSKHENEE